LENVSGKLKKDSALSTRTGFSNGLLHDIITAPSCAVLHNNSTSSW